MRRREFMLGLAGALAASGGAHAEEKLPTVGFLNSGSRKAQAQRVQWYLQGLGDEGFVDGKNVTIDYRWAEGDYSKLPELAAELVKLPVAVIATPASTPAAVAAKAATTAIPIVFGIGIDPVELGLVASLARPGGNVTGVTTDTPRWARSSSASSGSWCRTPRIISCWSTRTRSPPSPISPT
jgi:putative tryptophan/tyrosine transport system substrate-binding protein